MKFRKKPVIVEAVQWTGKNWDEIEKFSPYGITEKRHHGRVWLEIGTLEGTMRADINDWIIEEVNGEYYPCKDEIFKQTYEPVEDNK